METCPPPQNAMSLRASSSRVLRAVASGQSSVAGRQRCLSSAAAKTAVALQQANRRASLYQTGQASGVSQSRLASTESGDGTIQVSETETCAFSAHYSENIGAAADRARDRRTQIDGDVDAGEQRAGSDTRGGSIHT